MILKHKETGELVKVYGKYGWENCDIKGYTEVCVDSRGCVVPIPFGKEWDKWDELDLQFESNSHNLWFEVNRNRG